MTSMAGQDRASFDVDYGTVVMRVTLALPGPFTLWHGSTPDVAPARRESFYLEQNGAAARFVTTFAPEPKPAGPN